MFYIMVKDTILYDRLNVQADASESQIQSAYRKLSKTLHPDKYTGPPEEGKIKFQEINEAKDILLDNEKRQLYNQIGIDILKGPQQNNMGDPFGGFSNMFGGGGFGNMFGGRGMNPRQKEQEHVKDSINVSLEQLYKGTTINFTYKQKVSCGPCNGEGSKDGKSTECKSCGGQGVRVQVIRMGPMIQQSVGECPNCRGQGKCISDDNRCDTCKGKCFNIKKRTLDIQIKAGLMHGNQINLFEEGHHLKSGKTNLILVINELPHERFQRYQNDLFTTIKLCLYQALFGFEKVIEHLDGRKLHISCQTKTDFNTVRKIAREGIKSLSSNSVGDLYVRFIREEPDLTILPNETKTQLKSIIQSFDKLEVQNESQIAKMSNLTKIGLSDCRPDQSKQIIDLLEQLNKQQSDNKHRKHTNAGSDNEQSGPQCVQQ